MVSTPTQNIYTSAVAIMGNVAGYVASSQTLALAATNYGTDFKITPGQGVYQIRVAQVDDYVRSNVSYPRAQVTILVHFYRQSLAQESVFCHRTMDYVRASVFSAGAWQAETGIFSFDPDEDLEISEGERIGNVITFELTLTLIANVVTLDYPA